MHVGAIIAAAGRGTRFGGAQLKQLVEIGGRTILQRSLDAFAVSPRVREVVVVLPVELAGAPPLVLPPVESGKLVRIVPGGRRRQDSVANGFDALDAAAELILVHDAARPFVSEDLIARTLDAAAEIGAAVPALVASDTVKQAAPSAGTSASAGRLGPARVLVERTLARETIYLAQTPQAFRREVLRAAIQLGRSGVEATDEAALAEQAGYPVQIVEGDPRNIKITTPADLELAGSWSRMVHTDTPAGALRVGIGYDLHRLVPGRPLVLGGVTLPSAVGLDGHSDADALCHAVTDAVLGAAGAGDIGQLFPDTDDRWKGASSVDLLQRAADLVTHAGFSVENVDAVVLAEHPRLVPFLPEMRARLAAALGVRADQVSVKGKTGEGLGEVGRREAIAVHAVALLRRAAAAAADSTR